MEKTRIKNEAEAIGMTVDQYHEMAVLEAEKKGVELGRKIGKEILKSESTTTITLERYDRLVKAEAKLETVKKIAEQSKTTYGYSKEESDIIDAILGVTRA